MRNGWLGNLGDALRHTSLSYYVYRYRYLATFTLIGFFSILVEIQLARIVLPEAWPWQAKMIVAFLLGLCLSCTLNVTMNFKVPRGHLLATFYRYALVSCLSFLLNMMIVALSQEYLGQAYGAARLLSAAFLFVIAYSIHRRYTFDLARNVGVAVYAAQTENVERIHELIGHNCDHIHVDLVDTSMSGSAAPVDLTKLRQVRQLWRGMPVCLHVMSQHPRRWAEQTWDTVDWFLFHVNCKDDLADLIALCRMRGKKVGVVWHTSSSLGQMIPWLPHVDFVMVLGIATPGQSGQAIVEDAVAVTTMLDRLRHRYGFEVMFDGGVSQATIGRIPAKYVVSASAVLRSANPIHSAHVLRTGGKYERVA